MGSSSIAHMPDLTLARGDREGDSGRVAAALPGLLLLPAPPAALDRPATVTSASGSCLATVMVSLRAASALAVRRSCCSRSWLVRSRTWQG